MKRQQYEAAVDARRKTCNAQSATPVSAQSAISVAAQNAAPLQQQESVYMTPVGRDDEADKIREQRPKDKNW